jgi:hypothetical protein
MGDALGTVAHSQKATTLRVMMASRSKLGFWPDSNTSPGKYAYPSVLSVYCAYFLSLMKYGIISGG